MSLNREFFNRESNIRANIVCDSVSELGKRVTTFVLEYPRFIHAELLTSRDLSKNSSSSRAIPHHKMVETLLSNPAVPLYWGMNQSGMQASNEEADSTQSKEVWFDAMYSAVSDSERLADKKGLNIHKQIANRVTEPFQMIKVVLTATSFDNLFNLRIHPDAQPEFLYLAHKMKEATNKSKPKLLKAGQWHLPFVTTLEVEDIDGLGSNQYYFLSDKDGNNIGEVSLEDAKIYSMACCAAVSYRTEQMTMEKAHKIYNMLVKADVLHSSPMEHLCTPIVAQDGDVLNVPFAPETWQDGVTHIRKSGDLCSANFVGWVQYRHLLENNTCYNYDHEKRMEMFNG